MLKILFSVVLIIFCWSAEAQKTASDTNFIIPIYIDGSIGLGNRFMFDLNSGYRINKNHAIGLSYIGWGAPAIYEYYDASISGLGLQYRLTPVNWLQFKFEGGFIVNSIGCVCSSYTTDYNRAKSSNLYYRASIAFRLGKWFIIGLSEVASPNTVFDKSLYHGTNPNYIPETSENFNALDITLGFTLDFNKTKK